MTDGERKGVHERGVELPQKRLKRHLYMDRALGLWKGMGAIFV